MGVERPPITFYKEISMIDKNIIPSLEKEHYRLLRRRRASFPSMYEIAYYNLINEMWWSLYK